MHQVNYIAIHTVNSVTITLQDERKQWLGLLWVYYNFVLEI